MDKRCTVYNHAERIEIGPRLIRDLSYCGLTQRFGLPPATLHRHPRHLADTLDRQTVYDLVGNCLGRGGQEAPPLPRLRSG